MRMKKIHLFALVFLGGLFYLLTMVEIEVVSPGQGTIIGRAGDVDIVTPDSGFVTSMSIKTGDKIEKKQVLFSYNNLDTFYKEKSLENTISLLNEKKDLIEGNKKELKTIYNIFLNKESIDVNNFTSYGKVFAGELSALWDQHTALLGQTENSQLQKKELTKQITLIKEKINLLTRSGAPKVEMIENSKLLSQLNYTIVELDSKLITQNEEYKRKFNEFGKNILERINAMDEEMRELTIDITSSVDSLSHEKRKKQANIIQSPVSGIVLDVKQNFTLGSYIDSSQKVLTIKQTQQQNLVEAKIESKYRPYVKKDSNVKIMVNSPGFSHHLKGRVKNISADSFMEDNGREERYFLIEIEPENDLSNDESLIGVQVNIFIVSKTVNIASYITSFVGEKIFFNVW